MFDSIFVDCYDHNNPEVFMHKNAFGRNFEFKVPIFSRWRGFAIHAFLILQYHRYLSLFCIGADYKYAPAGGVLSLVKFVVD